MNEVAQGVALFNEQRFWHAHEAWEALWLDSEGERRIFLQGLIQLAAAYHHVQRGTPRGAIRLFSSAAAKLHNFRDGFLGVTFVSALATASAHAERLADGGEIAPEEWPKLQYN